MKEKEISDELVFIPYPGYRMRVSGCKEEEDEG